ncbi:MAG: type III secretion T3S chaperone [Chlamydiales bacterium]|nr:type III secretion T3S chaperone [Chlamydiales bacterium]
MAIEYPLAKIIDIKRKRVDEAERNVKAKEEALQKELKVLAEKEAERDRVKQHRDDKLAQLRHEMDTGTTTDKIQQAKVYLKLCQEKVIVEEKKVAEQQEQVELAKRNVEVAKKELAQRRQDVDKLLTHRADWMKERRKEIEIEEGREQDEIGSLVFNLRKRRGY